MILWNRVAWLEQVCATSCGLAQRRSKSVGERWFHLQDFRKALRCYLEVQTNPSEQGCRDLLRRSPDLVTCQQGDWFFMY